MQPEGVFCQSCAMPLSQPEQYGTEADGSKSTKFCSYCYQQGKYTDPNITAEKMIELSARGWSDQDPNVSYEHAKTQMTQILPH